jgi:hypothetical protein
MNRRLLGFVGTTALGLAMFAPARALADPVVCQKQIAGTLRKFKKVHLKSHVKCLDAQNAGKISGPCPDALATFKVQTVSQKATAKIAAACTLADVAALGFPSDCAFEPAVTGIEGQCAALPVSTPTEFAQCLACWKGAELAEFLGIVYASHAVELCGTMDANSATCSDLPCTTPLPDQRDLGDTGENDCQRFIAKAATKYLLQREKILENCALKGGTRTTCTDGSFDPKVPLALATAETKKDALITNKCGNRDPVASPPFCCRTGVGQQCTPSPSPDDCENNLGGDVQEGKVCGVGGDCDPVPGQQAITWWENCPQPNTCGTAVPLTTLQDLIDCVDDTADLIVDELICLQFRANGGADWPCPPDAS